MLAWGDNFYGELGSPPQLDGNPYPQVVPGIAGATAIAVGYHTSFAILGDGHLVGWGRNDAGQLGNGTVGDTWAPVAVTGLSGVQLVAAGQVHALALTGPNPVPPSGRLPPITGGPSSNPPDVTLHPSITAPVTGPVAAPTHVVQAAPAAAQHAASSQAQSSSTVRLIPPSSGSGGAVPAPQTLPVQPAAGVAPAPHGLAAPLVAPAQANPAVGPAQQEETAAATDYAMVRHTHTPRRDAPGLLLAGLTALVVVGGCGVARRRYRHLVVPCADGADPWDSRWGRDVD